MTLLRWIAVPLAVPLAWLISLTLANAGELFGGGGAATGAAQQAPATIFLLLIGFLQVLLPGLLAPAHARRGVACTSFGIGCLIVCVLAAPSHQAVLLLPMLTGLAALWLVFRLRAGEAPGAASPAAPGPEAPTVELPPEPARGAIGTRRLDRQGFLGVLPWRWVWSLGSLAVLLLLFDSPLGAVRVQPYQNLGCFTGELQYYSETRGGWTRPMHRGAICTVTLPGGETHNIYRGCWAFVSANKTSTAVAVHIQRALLTRGRYYSIAEASDCSNAR